jgi:hypothetical protein
VHLKLDHKVNEDEIEVFLGSDQPAEKQKQKIYIVDDQLLKKSDHNISSGTKPKSKIFIKDVTLLRKPDLPNDINLPNIFDSLDLTTTDDDIFDDFLGTDDAQIFDDDFDFEEPVVVEPVADVEIVASNESPPVPTAVEAAPSTSSGKIFVRKNLCGDTSDSNSQEEPNKSSEGTSKIFVRSHEELTSQVVTTDVVQQPSESSTPDCVIVSSETLPPQNNLFIRNIEALTNPQDPLDPPQFFPANTTSTYLTHENTYTATPFTPAIFVRSYDSLVQNNLPESLQSQCKISIKNMNTLIEPTLMHPPLINHNIFGQAQNLVIHMRPSQTPDENLMAYRDTSVTPDSTLPGSSNVSTCADNDVIILDDSEINDNSFATFVSDISEPSVIAQTEPEIAIENPERNQTPNDKPKIDIQVAENNETIEDQPMTRIPISITNESKPEEIAPPAKKKLKIVKIIRVKKKPNEEQNPLNTVQVVFKCSAEECSLHFSTAKLLKYHKRCHNGSAQIICPECGSEEFKNFNTLHTHLWRQHGIDMDLHACKLCNFKTPFLSRLKNFHLKIHSNEKNYKCDYVKCNKRFKNSKQLKNHAQRHVNSLNKQKNVIPNIVENDSKKIRCQICNKGFSSESGLYIHFNEHKSEEKRFSCEEKGCEYSTNDHNSFRRHKFQHTKTHQYSCPACDYTSIQSNTYRKHLEKQHKELAETLLFKCGSCKFITISKSKYDGHLAKHMSSDS